jgi:hypothetical protein
LRRLKPRAGAAPKVDAWPTLKEASMQGDTPLQLNDPGRPAEAVRAQAPPLLVHADVVATEEAAQRVALWMAQTLAAQVEALKKLTEALQAAMNALLEAPDPRRMLELRDTLLSAVLDELARWQGETLDAWCSLQRDLARTTARSAGIATADLLEPAWWPRLPRNPRAEPSPDSAQAPDAMDAAFKAWQRLRLPGMFGAEATP